MTARRHERPVRRINPSGKVVWYARYTDARGRRGSAGTYATKREAQDAILAAYGRRAGDETVGVRVRANDPRVTKAARPTRVFSFEDMHRFATAAGPYQPMVRTFVDTGMRLGEVLPFRRSDLRDGVFHVVRTAHEGEILQGTKTDHGEPVAGRLVPCPSGLAMLLRAMPARIDTELLFATPRGLLWRERNFYRDVWYPTQERCGLDIRPHEMRHSYISHLRAAGVDDADLAAIAGHTVLTMVTHYTHALGKSFDRVRGIIG